MSIHVIQYLHPIHMLLSIESIVDHCSSTRIVSAGFFQPGVFESSSKRLNGSSMQDDTSCMVLYNSWIPYHSHHHQDGEPHFFR